MINKELLTKRIFEVIERKHLEEVLKSGKKLRIKYGADPTAPDLHLGHAVVFRKLKEFQDLGHTIIFIIGDYTALIGDPSGRSKARPMLSEKEIKANAATYFKQVGKILDVKKTEIVYNSGWFKKEDLASTIKLMAKFTIQRVLERDDFSKRIKEGAEVYAHEILYPMMQAYDSVMIKADVEVGGTDQKFNMLAGRDLQRHMGISEQDVITIPLLVGIDGVKKMSKSVGNYIGISEEPEIMFGKLMSIPDELILKYAELLTDLPLDELNKKISSDPRGAKMDLAKEIVKIYHSDKDAKKAEEEFVRVVSNKEIPEKVESVRLKVKEIKLIDLLVETKMASSKGEARRLIEQGGVKIDNEKQSDPNKIISLDKKIILQVGKHKFLTVSDK